MAKDFQVDARPDLFAAAHPLEYLKYLVSRCASAQLGPSKTEFMVQGVKKAYFYAAAARDVCADLPPERAQPGMCAELLKSLYGTRDAALSWAQAYSEVLEGMGFIKGSSSPCSFFHEALQVRTLVHGDDFVSSGSREALAWSKSKLDARFEIKTKIIGTDKQEVAETRILNRIVRQTESGWEYEPDQRHVDWIAQALGLEKANGCVSPRVELRPWEKEEDEEMLDAHRQYEYRAVVARANYLAADRVDIQ